METTKKKIAGSAKGDAPATEAIMPTKYDMNSVADMFRLADALKEHIAKRGLSVKIQERMYVKVEGWQFAGAMLGLHPLITKIENKSSYDQFVYIRKYKDKKGYWQMTSGQAEHLKYEAWCDVVNGAGETMGCGMGLCTNKESAKNTFDEYAVLSMAQTRAVGKALRLLLGWVIEAAGYDATPAEEVTDEAKESEESKGEVPPEVRRELVFIRNEMELKEFGAKHEELHQNEDFRHLFRNQLNLIKSLSEKTKQNDPGRKESGSNVGGSTKFDKGNKGGKESPGLF